jgi:hypothetical protein
MRALIFFAAAMVAAWPACGQAVDKSSYSLTNPTPRGALRELSTDRPDKTESPYTVDAGHLQVEMDFVTYTRDTGRRSEQNVRAETAGIAAVNFKLGLTNSTDIQLLVDPFVRQTVRYRTAGTRERIDGFGDATLRLKHNLWGNDGGTTALALMPFVKLPTASRGIGNGAVEYGLIVPLSIGVSERIGVGLMTEVDLLEESEGQGYAATFINSATMSFGITERLGAYTELYTERGSERGSRWIVTGDLGLTYALTDDLQLDGGVNLGITEAADDLQLFVGISRRF